MKFSPKQFRQLGIVWLIIITILFFLPGSALPSQGWLANLQFDKWVHFGFFALLVFLWRFYLPLNTKYGWLLLLIAALYGISVELIQHFFVANRSFDTGDLVADLAGSFGGLWCWNRYKKNRPL